MLLIDHTSLKGCQWQDTLLPYLSWAYQERASICLIQVGAALLKATANKDINPSELRATKMLERSILVPRISTGIEASAGRATPLAHGLDLALHSLRHALQHGRSRVSQATLVVITDGRGNVPLEASYSGNIKPFLPVKSRGIEDALTKAEQIHQLGNLNVIFLNPQPMHNSDLSIKLAKTLGVTSQNFILIPPSEIWEIMDE
jgi:magnesium chelatase subunit D